MNDLQNDGENVGRREEWEKNDRRMIKRKMMDRRTIEQGMIDGRSIQLKKNELMKNVKIKIFFKILLCDLWKLKIKLIWTEVEVSEKHLKMI